jgi:hypothetical protein
VLHISRGASPLHLDFPSSFPDFFLCVAKILSPPKMARFSLRHSGKSLNSTKNCVEERESSLGRERAHATYI